MTFQYRQDHLETVLGYHPLLAVAAGTGDVLMSRLHEGRANTVRGAAHFLRETVGRVRYAGAQRTTHGAGRQRLLCPRHRRPLPQDGCPLLHHHPPAQKPAQCHRGDTRGGLDAHPLLDGRCRRCGGDHLQSLSQKSKTITTFGLWMPVKTELCCLSAIFRNWMLF